MTLKTRSVALHGGPCLSSQHLGDREELKFQASLGYIVSSYLKQHTEDGVGRPVVARELTSERED